MPWLRSALFNVLFFGWTIFLLITCLWLLIPGGRAIHRMVTFWGRGVMAMLRSIVGITYEIRGRENLGSGPVLIASKHQSAWDTIIFHVLLDAPAIVLKKELLMIPVYGWYARRAGVIAVDRKGGASALKSMLSQAARLTAAGHSVVIFPEGTRAAPGAKHPYHPGVAALYGHLNLPAVPVALNSGLYWGRRSFIKRPGRIVLEILPPIPPGQPPRAFLKTLEERIEAATDRLCAEARSASPGLPDVSKPLEKGSAARS